MYTKLYKMKEFEQDIFDSKDYFQKTISNNSLD